MSAVTPTQIWWTADEIAASGLPDLPGTKRNVNRMADRQQWQSQPGLARRRKGKGGGWEYHWKLFPERARRHLLQAAVAAPAPDMPARDEIWAWYEALPAKARAKAERNLRLIIEVEALEGALGRDLAVNEVARHHGVGARTLWSWFALIDGVRSDDRLPHLAPKHRANERRKRHKTYAPEFFDVLKSDFLRLAQPSFSACYRRAIGIAKTKGWDVLPERTMRRHLDAQVSRPTQVLARKGIEAVRRLYPSQTRDKTAMVALEAVNADFHKFDVWVNWPKLNHPIRPQMVAFQDIYSGRILAWRIDVSPNSTAVLLCAGDMIERWGIPYHVLLDNGREFAAKVITGGAATRYRFKVKEDDIPGLFTALGCEIHWSTPYSGQSKPIERAFRDMCDTISRDPRFDGAWTGNRPDAKPEDYGSRAVDLEQFLAVVAEGIEEHNDRQGRRSEIAFGRSFADVFDESYATAPIRKATEAQRRMWLLGAEGLRADSKSGSIKFQGNEFWADWMHKIAGERVIARFDPADFWSGLHVYSADNAYLGHAPCLVKAGFFDAEEARTHQRARNAWIAAEKAAAKAHKVFTAAELGQLLDGAAPASAEAPSPKAKVVRPVFGKGATRPEPSRADDGAIQRAQANIVADLASRRPAPEETGEESARERFRRALELERQAAGGSALTTDQERWLSVYRTTPEYRAERMLWEDMGDGIFG